MAEGCKALEFTAMKAAALLLAALGLFPAQRAPRPRTPTPAPPPPSGTLMERARKERMDRHLLSAMRRAGVDAWIVVTREGARDPISFDVAAENVVGRAVSLFVDKGDHLEKVAIVASFDTEPFEKSGLYLRVTPYGKEGAGPALKNELDTLTPKAIAVDQSKEEPFADGLTA